MKILIKDLTECESAIEDLQAQSEIREIEIQDPKATLLNLRASVSIQLRLPVNGFWFYYRYSEKDKEKKKVVDFSNEKKLLTESGLEDGDTVYIYDTARPKDSVLEDMESAAEESMKRFRPEDAIAAQTPLPAPTTTTEGGSLPPPTAADEEDYGEDMEEIDLDDILDYDSDSVAVLFGKLIGAYPAELPKLQEQFVHNPEEVMKKISEEHPELIPLITKDQRAFLELMNSPNLVASLQEGELADEDDEEFDLNAIEELDEMLQSTYDEAGIQRADGEALRAFMNGAEEEEGEEGDYEEDEEDDEEEGGVQYGSDDKARILDFEPSEEDEKKIQELVQLGFSYKQCKVAFYTCHRSVERAANMLFESPPNV